MDPRLFLHSLFDAALAAADPLIQTARFLPQLPEGRVVVVGAGKAAAKMARAIELAWPEADLSGLVITRYGHHFPCEKIEVIEAAHPVPDQAGQLAAKRIIEAVSGLTERDLVVVLISGGGSSLLSLPAPLVSLADKRNINAALLKSGAAIGDMNCVRKHLSAIKGGRLGLAIFPAQCLTLLVSDVPGDFPDIIASGPTFGEAKQPTDALGILQDYGIVVPPNVLRHLHSNDAICPSPDDPRFAHARWHMIATPLMALEAAANTARQQGVTPIILGDNLEGPADRLGREHALLAQEYKGRGPVVFLSGGETVVRVTGNGRGGRNVEYLLSLCHHLDASNVFALAADSDGIDGMEDVAGAFIAPDTKQRAALLGMKTSDYLQRNDAHSFFERLRDQIITGPTLTNVNDFRAILIV
ncbi:glycerate kinase [Brucella sp. NBRC 12950]|uniref:glycerate kinase type-2 family protein n=1 Tax=Brucella sp. NBRC 12950 TaxID=2994518 RepID=UPI0024A054C6|nr:glycerate kinase [Brucella sp. NBRC 12950]GLU29821.1 hydroxypyruvate reductase [Brucella sp. NBRC 12950]